MPDGMAVIPAAVAVVRHKTADPYFLMARRNQPEDAKYHDKWHFPGGRVRHDEQPHQAAEREILEEYRLKVTARYLIPIVHSDYSTKRGVTFRAVTTFYECYLNDEQDHVYLDDPDATEYAWMTLEELKAIVDEPASCFAMVPLIYAWLAQGNKIPLETTGAVVD